MHTISATGSTQHRQGSYLARAARTMINTKALCSRRLGNKIKDDDGSR